MKNVTFYNSLKELNETSNALTKNEMVSIIIQDCLNWVLKDQENKLRAVCHYLYDSIISVSIDSYECYEDGTFACDLSAIDFYIKELRLNYAHISTFQKDVANLRKAYREALIKILSNNDTLVDPEAYLDDEFRYWAEVEGKVFKSYESWGDIMSQIQSEYGDL